MAHNGENGAVARGRPDQFLKASTQSVRKEEPMPELQYVGGLVIRADRPRELARWYSETFGLLVGVEFQGVLYGGFRSGDISFHFGIAQRKGRGRGESCEVAITFRVDDLPGYVAELRRRGLEPVGEVRDEEGSFATYRDPENNEVTIWGL